MVWIYFLIKAISPPVFTQESIFPRIRCSSDFEISHP